MTNNLPTTVRPGTALAQAGSNGRLTRKERQASRSISETRLAGEIVKAQEAVKIDAIRAVTEEALLAASDISSLEAALAARTPHAIGRLSYIADIGAQGLGRVVSDLSRGL